MNRVRIAVFKSSGGLTIGIMNRITTAACWATRRDMDFEITHVINLKATEIIFVFDEDNTTDTVHFKLRWGV